MGKKQIVFCLIVIFGLQSGIASAAVLSLNPASVNAVESGSFDVDVVISDLGGQLVGGFDITVGYDPSLLTATNVAYSGKLGLPDIETITLTDLSIPGSANAFELSLLSPIELAGIQPGDSLQLATLSFSADNVGVTSLLLTSWLISDDLGFEIMIQAAEGARVDISPIPLPGALWLMISGLFGIGAIARKRDRDS